jgi:hypothetical protein
MKLKVFGWLIVGCLLYVCPNAMGQVISANIVGSLTTDPAVAGITEAGAPWTVTSGSITISDAGVVKAKIKGLIITTPAGSGVGPVTEIAASLVCGGAIVATTTSAPISSEGNAKIKDTITLPARCVDPIVLIQVAAATGFGTIPTGGGPFIASSGFTTASGEAVHNIFTPEK